VRLALSSILIALALMSAAGCQACLDEKDQANKEQPQQPTSSTRPPVGEGPARMRPKLIAPKVEFLVRDASDDE
jgi:hypothetical protein